MLRVKLTFRAVRILPEREREAVTRDPISFPHRNPQSLQQRWTAFFLLPHISQLQNASQQFFFPLHLNLPHYSHIFATHIW